MQKTAYDVRIIDWSSDVCSSDLIPLLNRAGSEILDQDVGLGDQLTGERLTLFGAQVDRDRIFVAPDHAPPAGLVALAPVAHLVAGQRRFELDVLGPPIANDNGGASCQVRVCK